MQEGEIGISLLCFFNASNHAALAAVVTTVRKAPRTQQHDERVSCMPPKAAGRVSASGCGACHRRHQLARARQDRQIHAQCSPQLAAEEYVLLYVYIMCKKMEVCSVSLCVYNVQDNGVELTFTSVIV